MHKIQRVNTDNRERKITSEMKYIGDFLHKESTACNIQISKEQKY